MDATFTPGPWSKHHRLNSIGNKLRGGRFVILQDGSSKREDFFIAEMPFAACRAQSEQEHEANGLLIAAAPDLFAAVDKLIKHAQPDNWDDDEEGVEHANAWRRAFNALAKAGGRPAPYTLTEESA